MKKGSRVIGSFRPIHRSGNYELYDSNVPVHYLAGKRRLVKNYLIVEPQIQLKGLDTQKIHWAFF